MGELHTAIYSAEKQAHFAYIRNNTKWYYSLRVVGFISYCKKRFYPRINAHFFMRIGISYCCKVTYPRTTRIGNREQI